MNTKPIPFLFLLLIIVLLAQAFVAKPKLTTNETASLPPRPTVMPTAVPTRISYPPNGGEIELHVAGVSESALWTLVQWQDAQGAWHDVEGWQGELDADHSKTWWVGAEYLGAGPFRWLVLSGAQPIAISDTFSLPARAGAKVVVTTSLE